VRRAIQARPAPPVRRARKDPLDRRASKDPLDRRARQGRLVHQDRPSAWCSRVARPRAAPPNAGTTRSSSSPIAAPHEIRPCIRANDPRPAACAAERTARSSPYARKRRRRSADAVLSPTRCAEFISPPQKRQPLGAVLEQRRSVGFPAPIIATRTAPAGKKSPAAKVGQPGASILEHREACSPWGERGQSWSCSGPGASWCRIGPCPASPQHPASQPTIGNGNPALRRYWNARDFSVGVMRERDWRQLYIKGKPPEEAARQAETQHYNTRPPIERMQRKR
jgi:hypothetical protein